MESVTSGLGKLSIDDIPIYLLKTRSSPGDAYEDHFSSLEEGKFKPIFTPVLDHIFRDDALRNLRRSAERFAFAGGSEATARQIASNNPAKKYGGMIFTSQRSVDAFSIIVAKLDPAKLEMLFDPGMPMYVVGPATARGLEALGLPCPIVGEETGNGEALAKFIQQYHAGLSTDITHLNGRKLPLLFMVGEQRRDIIPRTLQSENLPVADQIPVLELVVYETGEMATFEEEFSGLLTEAKSTKIKEQWVVVFSPQGCEAMLLALGWLEERNGKFSEGRKEMSSGPTKTFIATIGPTTREFLVQQFGYEPDVVATKPSPEGVGEDILAFRKRVA